jgi:hypothetical protein
LLQRREQCSSQVKLLFPGQGMQKKQSLTLRNEMAKR